MNLRPCVIDHDTTINYAELYGIKLVLSSLCRYSDFLSESNKRIKEENINIYTDSQFVFNILNEDGYSKIDYYYKLLMIIFDLCNKLAKNGKHINIIKINSHKGNSCNQIADKLAREAANMAQMCKFGESRLTRYDLKKNPINVDIAKDLIKLRKRIKNERKQAWLDIKKDRIENQNKNMYNGCHNFENAIIENNNCIRSRNSDMKNELKYLTQQECEIITKLRTEHSNLNHYLFTM